MDESRLDQLPGMEQPELILDRHICPNPLQFVKEQEDKAMIPSNPSPDDSMQFLKFLKLPTELRLWIWRCSFPDGCYVQIREPRSCLLCRSRNRHTWLADHEWRLPNPDNDQALGIFRWGKQSGPQTLRVCREARAETLRHYFALFEDDPTITTVYFSQARDVLSLEFNYGKFIKEFQRFAPKMKEQLKFVKRVSLESMDLFHQKEHLQDEFWACLKGVEELIFNDMFLCPWNAGSIQKKLQVSREHLAILQKLPGGYRIPAKRIKVLTYDHVLHE